jgi:hypothetical protein
MHTLGLGKTWLKITSLMCPRACQIFLGISLLLTMDFLPLIVYGQLMKLRYLLDKDCQVPWGT